MLHGVDVRIVLGCALLGAIVAGTLALAGGTDYRARSFVIRVPPDFSGERGLALARGDAVLGRALELAGEDERDPGWLRERSTAELTSRQDLSFTVEAPAREQSAALATAYAKAYREQIPRRAGLTTSGRGRPRRAAHARAGRLDAPGRGGGPLAGDGDCDRTPGAQACQPRIRSSTSSRLASMCFRETSDSRLSRSSGSVLDGRTLKCQSS